MKSFEFSCYGHENILATHKNTLEFTKDELLSLNGDCIIGVRADFDYSKLMEFVNANKGKEIVCSIGVDEIRDGFLFEVNSDFNDGQEIVIRRGIFNSGRTLGFGCSKAANEIDRSLVSQLKNGKKMKVIFYEKNTK